MEPSLYLVFGMKRYGWSWKLWTGVIFTVPQPTPQLTIPTSVCFPPSSVVRGPPLSPWANIIWVLKIQIRNTNASTQNIQIQIETPGRSLHLPALRRRTCRRWLLRVQYELLGTLHPIRCQPDICLNFLLTLYESGMSCLARCVWYNAGLIFVWHLFDISLNFFDWFYMSLVWAAWHVASDTMPTWNIFLKQ